MKKQFLLFFALVCSLVMFGQDHKNGGWDISVGPTLSAPLAKNVGWSSKAWGENVRFQKNNLVFNAGFRQNKAGAVQMPVLVGVRKHLIKGLNVGLDGGVTFFNGQKGQFTYVPSVGYRINKRWCLEQSILRTLLDGKHTNYATMGVLFHL